MASVLDLFIKQNNNNDDDHLDDLPYSTWINQNGIIYPSTNLTLIPKLHPGIYLIDRNNDFGIHCRQMTVISDELVTFTNNSISDLLEEIEMFWGKRDAYKENNLIHKRGILLAGYPGTGKSSLITLLSTKVIEKNGLVFFIKNPSNFIDYLDFLKVGFSKIEKDVPLITVIEDIDQFDRVEIELLDFLDGKTNLNNHVVIVTSNNTEELPETYLRPSRIDLQVEIPLPCEKTREEYFRFKKVPEDDITELVAATEDCSIADLKEIFICKYLLDYSLEESIDKIFTKAIKKNFIKDYKNQSSLGI